MNRDSKKAKEIVVGVGVLFAVVVVVGFLSYNYFKPTLQTVTWKNEELNVAVNYASYSESSGLAVIYPWDAYVGVVVEPTGDGFVFDGRELVFEEGVCAKVINADGEVMDLGVGEGILGILNASMIDGSRLEESSIWQDKIEPFMRGEEEGL